MTYRVMSSPSPGRAFGPPTLSPLPPGRSEPIAKRCREGEREEEAHATAGASEGEGVGTLGTY